MSYTKRLYESLENKLSLQQRIQLLEQKIKYLEQQLKRKDPPR